MKRFLLLLAIICGVYLVATNTFAKDGKTNDQVLKKSQLSDFPPGNYPATSYPRYFTYTGDPINNPRTQPQISTGYYLVHSNDPAAQPWRPNPSILDTTEDALNWYRILSGPNQRDESYWVAPENLAQGRRYFRNPLNMEDSTDNAIAGPIPIGFKFVFNGIEYDSFYVSTNGAIFLSNSRYFYDVNGNRQVRSNNYGPDNCYNTMSLDWFDRGGRSGDGTSDATADDWGWRQAVLYGCNATYAANNRPDNNGQGMNIPIIAPFWGDGWLSQWDADEEKPQDRGRVYYYKDPQGYKLIVYFVDWQLQGPVATPYGTVTISNPDGLQPWDNYFITASAQIVLDRRDSSITITYERFRGRFDIGIALFEAKEVIRFGTSCAVSGPARHLNYDSKIAAQNPNYTGTLPWAAEYDQSTYAWSKYVTTQHTGYPENSQAIKFKQWKNSLRVCDLSFRVRKQEENSPEFTEEILTTQVQNYEILAGHEQIGQVQPVAIVQNLTNDIQGPNGVNFTSQDLNFRVRCVIINQATKRPLYNRYVKVDSTNIAKKLTGEAAFEKVYLSKVKYTGTDYEPDTLHSDYYDQTTGNLKPQYNGIPPYAFATVFFAPYEPNELFDSHIGLMKAYIMIDPTDPRTGEGFKDMWPFDDTLNIRFWVMRQIPNDVPFIDDVTEFHVVPDDNNAPTAIPSVFKWVSIGATVVNGENVSRAPLPPRGEYLCENDEVYPTYKVSSPTIKMTRPATVPMGSWGGDEIRSFPIDMTGKFGSVLTLAVQRTTARNDWERGWSDGAIIGCEHRVIQSNWYAEVQVPDEIRVQFARPTENWRAGTWITNIPKDNWTYHPRRNGASPEKKMSAYTLFGGGGYMVGFLETDRDSALAPPVYSPATSRAVNGLRYNIYDDGIDFEYQKLYVPIPDTFIRAKNEGAKYFRFRVQVYAKNNQVSITAIPDDRDDWYVDNVRILYATDEDVDVELTKVAADWPYTMVPASQATAVPIRMTLSNNTDQQAPSFWVKAVIVEKSKFDEMFFLDDAWIYNGNPDDPDYEEMVALFRGLNQAARDSARKVLIESRAIYSRVKQFPFLRPGANESVTMPDWNARLSPPGKYVIIGLIYVPGGDLEPRNDTTYSEVNMVFGPVMAYHPIQNANNFYQATNDVAAMTQIYGRGLTIYGYKLGGVGTNWSLLYEIGDEGGDGGSGQIAMRFILTREDTIKGYGAFFDYKNQSPDHITYRMYEGEDVPQNLIPNSIIQSKRGYDERTGKDLVFGQFVFDMLDEPIVLPKGSYWVAVGQLGEDGIELGASKSRVGMRSTNVYYSNPQTIPQNGTAGTFLNIHKEFRKREKGGSLLNMNYFALENGLGSGEWMQFMNTTGNPVYAHLPHEGIPDGATRTWSRGTWMPLIVPYLGNRTWEPLSYIPVELVYFKGFVRNGANHLVWETASEVNNYGFYVERRIVGADNDNWTTLPEFIPGHGTSNEPNEYTYVDRDVVPNTTYQYRLRQVDNDGTQSSDDFSNIVTLTYTESGSIILAQNTPNPFTDGTTIKFSIPTSERVKLEILDIYGNIVTTLVDETLSAGDYAKVWRAYNADGTKCATGTYIYRLSVGEQILTGKMTLVK